MMTSLVTWQYCQQCPRAAQLAGKASRALGRGSGGWSWAARVARVQLAPASRAKRRRARRAALPRLWQLLRLQPRPCWMRQELARWMKTGCPKIRVAAGARRGLGRVPGARGTSQQHQPLQLPRLLSRKSSQTALTHQRALPSEAQPAARRQRQARWLLPRSLHPAPLPRQGGPRRRRRARQQRHRSLRQRLPPPAASARLEKGVW
mmetsp:Transcript_36780/g.92904  ORF Transcript_36780/g.92904 Transcript_36780/m.92904 type:complete len:206 (+) Transcript_36780:1067-1684(+)